MTNKEFFDWLRQQQDDKRLTQLEVDGANKLLAGMTPDELKDWLMAVGDMSANSLPRRIDIDEAGVALIGQFEAFVPHPYKDSGGVWTIGYGSTYYPDGRSIKPNDPPISKQQALEIKKYIIARDFVPAVRLALAKPIANGLVSQNMFNACVSLAYNIGVKAFVGSSVVRNLNAGKMQAAADSFLLWNKDNGKIIKGLVNRRNAERELFLA